MSTKNGQSVAPVQSDCSTALRCERCGIADDTVIDLDTGSACHPELINCIERLKAALPKTCDGVPIVPGMDLFTCYWADTKADTVEGFGVHLKQPTIWANGEADEGWLFADRDKCEEARASR